MKALFFPINLESFSDAERLNRNGLPAVDSSPASLTPTVLLAQEQIVADEDTTLFNWYEQAEVEYRDIPDFPGYMVGNDGSVWSCRIRGYPGGLGSTWRQLKQSLGGKGEGHYFVSLQRECVTFLRYVHRLVLEAFVGPCPEGMECCHEDGNRDNNNLSNLRWDTHANNCADMVRHGRSTKGEKDPRAKLTESEVREIRSIYAKGGISQRTIANMFHVGQKCISFIIRRVNWGWLE